MSLEHVKDEELLYRAVRNDPGREYKYIDGALVVSASAFNDAGLKPSVDRAELVSSPIACQKNPSDGIVCLLTGEVRSIDSIVSNPGSCPTKSYQIDVIARPIEPNESNTAGNAAHAQVEHAPEEMNKSRFRKLKEALAMLANKRAWAIEPS